MFNWTRSSISPLMLEAGRIALHFYADPERDFKDDGSVVTIADRTIEAFFAKTFDRPAEGCFLLGEETVDQRSMDYLGEGYDNQLFVVDPIDGTAPYSNHIPLWGVSVGMAVAGVLQQGAVYLPVTGELFVSEGDAVYLAICRPEHTGPIEWTRLSASAIKPMNAGSLLAVTQQMAKTGVLELPHTVHCLACAVVPLTYLLLGRYAGYYAHFKLWDLAGAMPMLMKLGFSAMFFDGEQLDSRIGEDGYFLSPSDPLRWKLRQPCLFCLPENREALMPGVTSLNDVSLTH